MAKRISGNVNVELYFNEGTYSGRVSSRETGVLYKFAGFQPPKGFTRPQHKRTYDAVARGAIKKVLKSLPYVARMVATHDNGLIAVSRSR